MRLPGPSALTQVNSLIDDPANYEAPADLLAGRVILITGASDGIGRALSLATAKLGAQVILHGRNVSKLEAAHDDIVALDDAPRPSIAVLDLATADSVAYSSLADGILEEFGRLDGLVHNAGVLGKRLSIEQYDPKHLKVWDPQPDTLTPAGPDPPLPQGETLSLTYHPIPDIT